MSHFDTLKLSSYIFITLHMAVTSFPKDLMLKSQSNYSLVNSHEQEINTPEKATRTSQVRPHPWHRVAPWHHLPIQHTGSRNHTCSIVFWTIFKLWFFSVSKVVLNPGPDTSKGFWCSQGQLTSPVPPPLGPHDGRDWLLSLIWSNWRVLQLQSM